MAMEKTLTSRNQHYGDVDAGNCKSSSVDVNSSGGFDCNICLDSVHDPVVTLCGHLYCWPCIYKWIQHSPKDQENAKCPICKADVSEKTLIPLYGPAHSSDVEAQETNIVIPCRPKRPPSGVHASSQQPAQRGRETYPRGYYDYNPSGSAISLAGSTTVHPMIGMFGEMICSRYFGNSEALYTYPNSYSVAATSSPRARRQARKVDRSLSRLSFFLLCCLFVCLILF